MDVFVFDPNVLPYTLPFTDVNIIRYNTTKERDEAVKKAKLCVSIGGDGTFLSMIRYVVHTTDYTNKVFMGLNKGSLGFLTAGEIATTTLADFVNETNIVKRHLLRVQTLTSNSYQMSYQMQCFKVLNEITITGQDRGKLFNATVSFDNHSVLYSGDGIIVSSPTGATAYNLSAGGPILYPTYKSCIVTPINPFTLADRSLVLPDDVNIDIAVKDAVVFGDGLKRADSFTGNIKVSIDSCPIKVLQTSKFIDIIEHKLGWNRSIK